MKSFDLVNCVANTLDQKNAKELNVLDIGSLSIISDYFVIATGNTQIQVRALADAVFDKLRDEHGVVPRNIEGYNSSNWIILDYVDVIVHIFDKQSRDFYCLDKMWSDATEINLFCRGEIT